MSSSGLGFGLVLFVLTTSAAVLAIAETSITRMSRAKALGLVEEGRRGAAALVRILDNPARYLSPVLLLVLVCQMTAATFVGVVAGDRYGPTGVVIATCIAIAVFFVVAEALPKTYAIAHVERAALAVAPVVIFVSRLVPVWIASVGLFAIARRVLPNVEVASRRFMSEVELRALADVAVEEEVIEGEERRLIHSIIEFGDTVAREVMVPRTDMVFVVATTTVAEALEVTIERGLSRIPVAGENIDDIVGLLFAKDLMRALRDGRDRAAVSMLLRPARFVPETKRVAELLREMQRDQFHMAIVVDEYGGTAGLATLEDLIEELVGEIVDEFDVEDPLVEPLPGGDVLVDARLPLDELNDLLHADFPTGDWDTVGGLLYNLLGHVPVEGETIVCDGHRLRAEKIKGRRIAKVRVSAVAPRPVEIDGADA